MGVRIGPFIIGSPTAEQERAVLGAAPTLDFNYHRRKHDAADATSLSFSLPYTHDVSRTKIGQGRKDYKRARALLNKWEHFNLAWAYTNSPRVAVDAPVLVTARSLGLWTMNPLRVCKVESSRNGYSFTHRTLAGHQLSGEERFVLELGGDGCVWYGVETVSRPATVVSALSFPVVRWYQGKFKRDSLRRMQVLVGGCG